ncbi:AcrR family transcriptional regulator [Bifidobacterium lemurum]|uniref:AcrR family transcriptional regulator n=1 Tax=Bifidobacterium lemurum TaxID=1603886 RepID=A0A261FST9_9BIFI|nr:TetR/AcrR family transcriptional regulator [Bifidobacterium lemurum]OZG62013.1 AcrR family transcriptional regulator [Bifidobacterium lemurum]QOL34846.1 TetR/AcrR family transcriptional regulator [Bifidobacterium lemurum]
MARNAHPEVTRRRILDAAQKLFFTKGYEHTTMRDILDELGDLSKGAIYHHFASKETILDALCEEDGQRMKASPIRNDDSLDGLHKMRALIANSVANMPHMRLMGEAYPTLEDPTTLAANLRAWRTTVADMFLELIDAGIEDGSITTDYPREAAEIISLLTNYWLAPTFYPGTQAELRHRVKALALMCDSLGVPLLTDELSDQLADGYAAFLSVDESHTGEATQRSGDDGSAAQ